MFVVHIPESIDHDDPEYFVTKFYERTENVGNYGEDEADRDS